jgi:hypothetical protein
MTGGADDPDGETEGPPPVEDGRYLYCLVDPEGDEQLFEARGVADEPARLERVGGVGVVVHDCERAYDTGDPDQLREWLLAHQRVVDAAAEAFGTPLPVRFDTIIRGGDEGLAGWLADHTDRVREELDRLAGRREYRVEALWDPEAFEARMREEDDRLREIEAKRQDAEEGTGFLLGKQVEDRLRELKRDRRAALYERLVAAVDGVCEAREERDPAGDDDGDRESVGAMAVLCPLDREDELGEALDDYVADRPVEVRFTGPWPPYTFTPELS